MSKSKLNKKQRTIAMTVHFLFSLIVLLPMRIAVAFIIAFAILGILILCALVRPALFAPLSETLMDGWDNFIEDNKKGGE